MSEKVPEQLTLPGVVPPEQLELPGITQPEEPSDNRLPPEVVKVLLASMRARLAAARAKEME